jgi:hypothetical protein
MNRARIDLFVEDRGHEEFVKAVIARIAAEEVIPISVHVRTARGGHGRVLSELQLYQKMAVKGLVPAADLMLVAIDANCKRFHQARKEIHEALIDPLEKKWVIACPDPHVERWYMADPDSFELVVGARPKLVRRKCKRDYYKTVLSKTIREAGHIPMLGGIEFARELVDKMDLYRAGKNDNALNSFIAEARSAFREIRKTGCAS